MNPVEDEAELEEPDVDAKAEVDDAVVPAIL